MPGVLCIVCRVLCPVYVVCCVICLVCWIWCVVCCAVCVVRGVLCDACCALWMVRCVLCVVCCALCVACHVLRDVRNVVCHALIVWCGVCRVMRDVWRVLCVLRRTCVLVLWQRRKMTTPMVPMNVDVDDDHTDSAGIMMVAVPMRTMRTITCSACICLLICSALRSGTTP